MKIKTYLTVSLMALTVSVCGLTACSSSGKKLDIDGERKPVLMQKADSTAVEVGKEVNISVPAGNQLDKWLMSGGNAVHNTGNVAFQGLGEEVWSLSIGEGINDKNIAIAEPVIYEGKVFTIDAEGMVIAADAETGVQIWSNTLADEEIKNPISGEGLAIGDNKVFAVTGAGYVVALAINDGQMVWKKSFDIGLRTAPTFIKGKVLVLTTDNRLLALNAANGKTLWTYETVPEDTILFGMPSPAATDKIVVVTFSTGELFALKTENGIPVWSNVLMPFSKNSIISRLSSIKARSVIDGNTVFAASGNSLLAIDLINGDIKWEKDIGSPNQPYIAGGYIYLMSSTYELIALDKKNGKVVWAVPFVKWQDAEDKEDKIIYSGPIMAGGLLYLAASDGKVFKVAPETGDVVGVFETGNGVIVSPTAALNKLFIVDADGKLRVYK